MKEEIRSKIRVEIDEETKQNFIEMGRKEAVENVQNMIGAGKLSSRKGMKKMFRVTASTSMSISNEQPN